LQAVEIAQNDLLLRRANRLPYRCVVAGVRTDITGDGEAHWRLFVAAVVWLLAGKAVV
jgi:hypothetical protein